MKHAQLLCVAVVAITCLWPATASAHVLKTDGEIGAVMHMDPDDDPIAEQESTFYFDIKDKQSKFRLDDCSCSFSVSQNGTELTNQAVSGSSSSGLARYIFPALGVYQIKLSGQPTAGTFKAFSLIYSVRVDRLANGSASQLPSNNSNLVIIAGSVVLAAILGIMIALSFKKSSKPKA